MRMFKMTTDFKKERSHNKTTYMRKELKYFLKNQRETQ